MIKFDLIGYLESEGIEYRKGGKNCFRNCVVVECPKCGDDPSMHMNVDLDGKGCHCVRCGAHISDAVRIVREILKPGSEDEIKLRDVIEIAKQFPWLDEELPNEKEIIPGREQRFNLLMGSFLPLGPFGARYLIFRGHDVEYARRFGVIEGTGRYDWYIVLPVKDEDGRTVSFKSRHVTKKVYKNCPEEDSIMSAGDCLFGLWESLQMRRDFMMVVEGEFDCLRFLENNVPAVALMKKAITDGQKELFARKVDKATRVYLMLDADVKPHEMEKRWCELSELFDDVKVIEVQGAKDAGECDGQSIRALAERIGRR